MLICIKFERMVVFFLLSSSLCWETKCSASKLADQGVRMATITLTDWLTLTIYTSPSKAKTWVDVSSNSPIADYLLAAQMENKCKFIQKSQHKASLKECGQFPFNFSINFHTFLSKNAGLLYFCFRFWTYSANGVRKGRKTRRKKSLRERKREREKNDRKEKAR